MNKFDNITMLVTCLISVAFLSGCRDVPSMYSLGSKFQRENPQLLIVRMSKCEESLQGQTFPAHVQFHIIYQRSGDTTKHERIYRYHYAPEAVVYDGWEDVY